MRTLFCISILLLILACEEGENTPQITAGTVKWQQRFQNPADSRLDTLQLRSDAVRVARVDNIEVPLSDISIRSRRVQGGGVLPYEAYVAATFLRPNNWLAGYQSGTGGDRRWLEQHTNQLAIVTQANYLQHSQEYDYSPADTALRLTPAYDPQSELQPIYGRSGTGYLARLAENDEFIPWHHPSVDPEVLDTDCFLNGGPEARCLDMQSLTRLLYGSLETAFNSAITGMSLPAGATAAPGGPAGDGGYKLRFIPQSQYRPDAPVGERIARPGIAFVFEGNMAVTPPFIPLQVAQIKVFLPVFLLFNRTSGTDRNFTFSLQPFEDLANGFSPAFGSEKIVLLAKGVFAQNVADTARAALMTSLAALPTTDPVFASTLLSANMGIELSFNRYLDPERQVKDLSRFQILALPTECVNDASKALCFRYRGLFDTQVQPEDENHTPIHVFLLED